MRNVLTFSALSVGVVVITAGFRNNQGTSPAEVKIGNQIWTSENLNVDHFRNGDPVFHAKTGDEWIRAGNEKRPAWCYYDFDKANGERYGKLYNWFAVMDERGLAPKGWHMPSDVEWTTLTEHLGGKGPAALKLKSTEGWDKNFSKSGDGTNESGFTALPGGLARISDGKFSFINKGSNGFWWSSTKFSSVLAWGRRLDHNMNLVNRYNFSMVNGKSVRCVRD